MAIYEGGGQLNKAARELLRRWEETKTQWDDPVSRELEQRHIQPLYRETQNAIRAMGQMAALLETIRRECS